MIEEAMRAVREAEDKAGEIVREAQRRADARRAGVKDEILAMEQEGRDGAERRRQERLEAAHKEGERLLASSREEAKKEADALRAVAAGKEETAINAVIEELIR